MIEAAPLNNDPLDGVPGSERAGRLAADQVTRLRELAKKLPMMLMFVITSWIAYLIVVPYLCATVSPLFLLLVPTVGLYFFGWLGYYRHELWHSYFPGIHNPSWYDKVSALLFSDPQVYRTCHPTHHKFIHTTRDLEFFTDDYENNRGRRRRQYILELLFGNIAWELYTFQRLSKEGRIRVVSARRSWFHRSLGVAALLIVAYLLAGLMGVGYSVIVFVLTLWLGALLTRHNQWLEHLGIVDNDGDIQTRNQLTRNLDKRSIAGKLYGLFTHEDADAHIYHHTDGRIPSRNTGLPLPDGALTIGMREYVGILVKHYREL
jgi:fatty acid desaturase